LRAGSSGDPELIEITGFPPEFTLAPACARVNSGGGGNDEMDPSLAFPEGIGFKEP